MAKTDCLVVPPWEKFPRKFLGNLAFKFPISWGKIFEFPGEKSDNFLIKMTGFHKKNLTFQGKIYKLSCNHSLYSTISISCDDFRFWKNIVAHHNKISWFFIIFVFVWKTWFLFIYYPLLITKRSKMDKKRDFAM